MDINLDSKILKRFKPIRILVGGKNNHVLLVQDRQAIGPGICVLKCPKLEFLHDSQVCHAIENEGKILCSMEHIHIIKGLEYGVCGTTPYLITKFFNGHHIGQNNLRESADYPYFVLHLALQLLDALVYFMSAFDKEPKNSTVVHRDLGFHNILISEKQNICIVDFETSRLYFDSEAPYVMDPSNQVPFKSKLRKKYFSVYSPPESLIKADPLIDIYSAGAMIFTLITGQYLRRTGGLGGVSYFAIEEKLIHDNLTPASKVAIEILKATKKATDHDRANRYQNAREFQSALLKIQQTCQQQIISAVDRRKALQA